MESGLAAHDSQFDFLEPPFLRSPRFYKQLEFTLYASYLAFMIFALLQTEDMYTMLGAIAITTTALVPFALWFRLPHRGIPLFQAFCMPMIWCYAFPLVAEHPEVMKYSPSDRFTASLTVAGFIIFATLIWSLIIRLPTSPPLRYRGLHPKNVKLILFVALAASTIFTISDSTALMRIPIGLYPVMRALSGTFAYVAIFVLGYLWGKGMLGRVEQLLFLIFVLLQAYSRSLSFILSVPVTFILTAVLAITLGRRKPPLIVGPLLLALFLPLHFGKYEMRARYWHRYQEQPSFIENAVRLKEWYQFSFNHIMLKTEMTTVYESDEQQLRHRSFLNRLSLMHKLIEVQQRAGKDVPFFNGATYRIIPAALIPRLINPGKISPHEGTYIMNIGYGHQRREDTRTTHIGWGLLAEAWANFGIIGTTILAGAAGLVLGLLTIWSRHTSLYSYRTAVAAILIPIMLHPEYTLAVLISIVLQSLILISAAALFLPTFSRTE